MLLERLLCYITVKMREKEGLYKRAWKIPRNFCLTPFLIIIISQENWAMEGCKNAGKKHLFLFFAKPQLLITRIWNFPKHCYLHNGLNFIQNGHILVYFYEHIWRKSLKYHRKVQLLRFFLQDLSSFRPFWAHVFIHLDHF